MAEKQGTSSKTDDTPRKKPAETVQLTAEDLKKISGGTKNPPPPVQPNEIKKH
jgi:hypothetical protein